MKAFFVIASLVLFSCSTKKEEKKVVQDGKDPDANWLTIYNADSALNDFNKSRYRLMGYGLQSLMFSQEAMDSLNRIYHITDYRAGDCEVTERFCKGVEEYNCAMTVLLERINGKYWYSKYSRACDALREAYMKAENGGKIDNDSVYRVYKRENEVNDSLYDVVTLEVYRKRLNRK